MIGDVGSELTATAVATRVTIHIDVPVDDRLIVWGAQDELARALTNLAANAIRHTGPGLVVRLQGRRTDKGAVQLSIIDACGGIPEHDLPHLFETGWEGSRSSGGAIGGTGLGLAIARYIVQSHAGQLEVRNVYRGCRFRVELPASPHVEGSGSATAGVRPRPVPLVSVGG